jgi:hypothetical protein
MTYQYPPRKSLGTLYRAEKTKPRSPDMLGAHKIQIPTVQEMYEFSKTCDSGEIVCPIAAWVNGPPGRQYLVIELSPPYRPKAKIPDPGPTLEPFFAEITAEQND